MTPRRELSATSPIRVACIGGGQLGRMMALEAPRLGIQMSFLDPLGADSPVAKVVPQQNIIQGSLMDFGKIRELAQGADVLTVEIEHVGVEALEELELEGVNVQPSSRVLSIIRDKLLQKKHFEKCQIPLPPFRDTPSRQAIKDAAASLGLPLMLKGRLRWERKCCLEDIVGYRRRRCPLEVGDFRRRGVGPLC